MKPDSFGFMERKVPTSCNAFSERLSCQCPLFVCPPERHRLVPCYRGTSQLHTGVHPSDDDPDESRPALQVERKLAPRHSELERDLVSYTESHAPRLTEPRGSKHPEMHLSELQKDQEE